MKKVVNKGTVEGNLLRCDSDYVDSILAKC